MAQEKAEATTASTALTGIDPSQISQVEARSAAGADMASGKKLVDEEVVWYEGPMDEPLDEDGNPYFDPYDPEQADRVVAKWAEEHTGSVE